MAGLEALVLEKHVVTAVRLTAITYNPLRALRSPRCHLLVPMVLTLLRVLTSKSHHLLTTCLHLQLHLIILGRRPHPQVQDMGRGVSLFLLQDLCRLNTFKISQHHGVTPQTSSC